MTLAELYKAIGGDLDAALKVLRIEKLVNKHIRKLPDNGIFASLSEAGRTMDPVMLFESAHAIKGVCANLGLVKMSETASEIADEFRPGSSRSFTDAEVKERIDALEKMFAAAADEIRKYAAEG